MGQPEIQLNYFDDHEDMYRMTDCLRLGWRLLHQQDLAAVTAGLLLRERNNRLLASPGVCPQIGARANLGTNLWGFKECEIASIRAGRIHYVARCQSRSPAQYVKVQIERRDRICHPFLDS
jgi:hypothetical protein